MNHLRIILAATACFFLYACTKQDPINPSGTRLVKIRTNMADSIGNDCATCFVYELFKYDGSGKLLTITDSGMRGLPVSGPNPYLLYYNTYHNLQYNEQNKLVKSGRDSFVYNSKNQVIQRLRRIISDTSRYWLIDAYLYDINGRLVTDSAFTGQTFANPGLIPSLICNFTYDANDNIIKIDNKSLWPVGSTSQYVTTASYDTRINPFKNLGLIPYFAYNNAFLLSTNNQQTQGYQYEYFDNGLLKKISYNKVIQEYIYE